MSSVTEFMKPGDVSQILGCKVETVLHFIHTGELPAMNIGRGKKRPSWRIHPDDWESFRKAKTKGKPPAGVSKPPAFANDIKRYG